MKLSAWLAGALPAAATLALACSSTPSRPPIETTGGNNPGTSGGGSASPSDASTDGAAPVPSDSGTIPSPDSAVDSGSCRVNCGGCCDPLDVCQPGLLNSACGVSGASCLACPTGTTCQGGVGVCQ